VARCTIPDSVVIRHDDRDSRRRRTRNFALGARGRIDCAHGAYDSTMVESVDAPTGVTTTVTEGVATITLDRPEALNAITVGMLEALASSLDRLALDDTVDVIVLTGAGRAFSAGVDLKALGRRSLHDGKVGDLLDSPARAVTERLTTIPKVVVARVNGPCFTGALELVLACDLAIATENATLGDTHAKFGLRPTWGMSQRLVAAVGVTKARELSYTARTFSGREAAAWGLVNGAVPPDRLDDAIDELVVAIRGNSPGSLAAYKDLYRQALDTGMTDGLAYEAATDYPITDTEPRIAGFR
jgi:enoyl-CoA hydratase/carnithine racemase